MGAFDALDIAGSSLGMHQTWLDALSNNIANANTVVSPDQDAFQAQMVIAQSKPQGGVDVTGIALSDPNGVMEYSPDSPLADEDGYVKAPAMDMSSQMTQLVIAQRGYQASVQVTKYATDSYSSALRLGGFTPYVAPTASATPAARTSAPSGPTGPSHDFGSMVMDGLNKLEGVQKQSEGLAVQAATGDLQSIHDYTIAATQAAVTTQVTVAVRNKAVEAFNEIMRMPV